MKYTPTSYAAILIAGLTGSISLAHAQATGNAGQLTAPNTSAASSLARADRNFATTAARAGLAEVAEAQIALQKSNDADIKKFAQRMVDDHSKANAQLTSIARAKGLNLPTAPSRSDQSEAERLQKLRGDAFDRRYVSDQTDAHKQAVSLFTTESKSGKDNDLKSFAAQTLPTLQDHYRMIRSIAGSGNVASAPK